MGELLAQHFHLDAVQQQAGGHVAVGGLLLDQGARRQDGALAHLLHRHAVVEVLEDALQDQLGLDRAAQPVAGILDQSLQPVQIQRPADAALHHVHHVRLGLDLGRRLLLGAQPCPLLAVEHVGARDIVLARAHQGELHLILDILDVQRAPAGLAPHQRGDHLLGEPSPPARARAQRPHPGCRSPPGTPWSSPPRSCPARSPPPRRCGE